MVVRKQGNRTNLRQKLSARPKISFDAEILEKGSFTLSNAETVKTLLIQFVKLKKVK